MTSCSQGLPAGRRNTGVLHSFSLPSFRDSGFPFSRSRTGGPPFLPSVASRANASLRARELPSPSRCFSCIDAESLGSSSFLEVGGRGQGVASRFFIFDVPRAGTDNRQAILTLERHGCACAEFLFPSSCLWARWRISLSFLPPAIGPREIGVAFLSALSILPGRRLRLRGRWLSFFFFSDAKESFERGSHRPRSIPLFFLVLPFFS